MVDITGEAAADGTQDSIASLYHRGVAQYRSGNYTSAISDLKRVIKYDGAREFLAQTLYYLARSYQESLQYSLAVENYRRLINGFPRYGQTGLAMLEAASCLRRLGKVEEARELLKQALLIPSVEEKARRELMSLE
jgi:tetratricopeptide (TPR) repeat protein